MKQILFVVLSAGFVAGCSTKPSTSEPGSESRSATSAAFPYEAKERFSFDTGIKDREGKPATATGIAISADGKLALVVGQGGQAGNVQVWDLDSRKKLYQYDDPGEYTLPAALSPDRKFGAYVTQTNHEIALLDLSNGKQVRHLRKKNDGSLDYTCTGLSFAPGSDLLLIASADEIIGWDPTTGTERFLWKETGRVTKLSEFFDGGKKLAVGTETGSIKVWDVASGKVVQTLAAGNANKNDNKDQITALVVNRDGKRLATSKLFGPMTIWDLTTGKGVGQLKANPGLWSALRFLPDNRTLVYNGDWGLALQDSESGETKSIVETPGIRQYPVSVTPDGSMFLSTQEDGKIRVWDLKHVR
jgi:WD40 repeat protein